MLTCQDVVTIASDYLEGDLPWRSRLGLRLHLMLCTHCRRYVRQLRATINGLARLREGEPDRETVRRQAEQLRRVLLQAKELDPDSQRP